MNNIDLHRDDQLRQFMKESELDMPFDDFEDKVMGSIEESLQKQRITTLLIKRSWFFYVIGLLLGFASTTLIGRMKIPEQYHPGLIIYSLQFLMAIAFLFGLERLIVFTMKHKQ